jgi:bifunctional non-homologous end joining protein LigD
MSLKEYSQKRNFNKTKEPAAKPARGNLHRFVVQKHAASRLHYDFRLEMGGTLKSWAVPKGVPYAKGEKHLAVQVEDHPVSYIDFEGTIPKGQYGAGTVMVWDEGNYKPLTAHPDKDLSEGKLHFVLHGQKLQGEWYLVRLRDAKSWLLVRGRDDMRPVSNKQDDSSAISGRTMEAIGRTDAVWSSKPEKRPSSNATIAAPPVSGKSPSFIEPMKARLVSHPPPGNWVYEIKFDGFRALAFANDQSVRLLSRNEKDLSKKFPQILEAVKALMLKDAIIDGEIVALDPKGRSSFQLLQAYDLGQEKPPVLYYVFDLLRLEGKDLRSLPLTERKELLKKALHPLPRLIRYSESLDMNVQQLLKKVQRLGLEGLIGKKSHSAYEAGRRSGAWIKLKLHREQEVVIGGYTEPEGSRRHFGSLLIGFYETGSLLFAGKVGTGFNQALLKALSTQFEPLATRTCPFKNLPEKRAGRYGAGITPSEMKRCHWLEPRLVCQVKYAEWTRDGKLRQPVFLGMRQDKQAKDVVRETPD